MTALEQKLEMWSRPLSDAQTQKCERAVREIRTAVARHHYLGAQMQAGVVQVFAQGSYANNINVRDESDVDVCVYYTGSMIQEPSNAFAGTPALYQYDQLKKDVYSCLVTYFGQSAVKWGNKAFDIKATTNGGVEADVVPCFQYLNYNAPSPPVIGTALRPDQPATWISNYPVQQRILGEEKNKQTNWRYKRAARIIKKLNYEMIAAGAWKEDWTPSFFLESATWNQTNYLFDGSLYVPMTKGLLSAFANSFGGDRSTWLESNGIKLLFRQDRPWSSQDLVSFANAGWRYLGLGS